MDLCIFFVMQKTAYEMRISDWSSDVCSSDLCPRLIGVDCECRGGRRRASDALDDDGGGHAAAGAHRDEAALEVAALELVEHGADEHRAGGADRVAEGHRAAVDVDLLAVDLEVADALLDHAGHGRVDLEEADKCEE